MKHRFWSLLIMGLIGGVFSTAILAQNGRNDRAATAASSLYVISAKAGAVNFVSGKVSVAKPDARKTNLLKGDNLEVGDKVTMGTEGKAEILLNPGSYVRLSENAEFEFLTTSLDDLQVKVSGGSSIFEVIADKDFKVTVEAGNKRFFLIKSGIYRVDINSEGISRIAVWKGKAQIDDATGTLIKGGKAASFIGEGLTIAKFDRDNKDNLEIWSKDRAKEIAKINEKLLQREMNRSLFNSYRQNDRMGFGAYGLWVFDASSRGACFFPFSYGLSSPYGYTYNQSMWSYPSMANFINNNIYNNQNGNNSGGFPNNPPMQQPPIYSPPNGGNNGGGNGGFPSAGSGSSVPSTPSAPPSRPEMPERQQQSPITPVNPAKID